MPSIEQIGGPDAIYQVYVISYSILERKLIKIYTMYQHMGHTGHERNLVYPTMQVIINFFQISLAVSEKRFVNVHE